MMQMDVGEEILVILPRLRRFALSLTGSRVTADDLVQGACERTLAAASSWTPGTQIDAWMFRIMRNLWIDTFRQRHREGVVIEISKHLNLVDVRGHREVEARITLERVRSAIAELPSDQREVLMLVCVEEMSYRTAADVLGLPIGTVMSRLSRARRRLAEVTGYKSARRPIAGSIAK